MGSRSWLSVVRDKKTKINFSFLHSRAFLVSAILIVFMLGNFGSYKLTGLAKNKSGGEAAGEKNETSNLPRVEIDAKDVFSAQGARLPDGQGSASGGKEPRKDFQAGEDPKFVVEIPNSQPSLAPVDLENVQNSILENINLDVINPEESSSDIFSEEENNPEAENDETQNLAPVGSDDSGAEASTDLETGSEPGAEEGGQENLSGEETESQNQEEDTAPYFDTAGSGVPLAFGNLPDIAGGSAANSFLGNLKNDFEKFGKTKKEFARLPDFFKSHHQLASSRQKKMSAAFWSKVGKLIGPRLAGAAGERIIKAEVLDASGKAQEKLATLVEENNGVAEITVVKPERAFQPGKYSLRIEMLAIDGTQILTSTQDFSWGVLAINVNKSIYSPDETAKISLAVLNESGAMVCDSKLRLEILNPKSEILKLSTEDGTIKVNTETCQSKEFTLEPDYEAEYKTGDWGKYEMILTAETANGTHTIQDSFEVSNLIPFDVERTTATRIFPGNKYPVIFNITANQDFQGEIIETVPSDFDIQNLDIENSLEIQNSKFKILNQFQISNDQNEKRLIWDVDVKKGDEFSLGYEYDAPDESPQFYLLGPLKFVEKNRVALHDAGIATETLFQESRQWQIAVDQVTNNGILFYGDTANAGQMKIQTFSNPQTYGSELNTLTSSTSNILHVAAKNSPTREEMMVGHLKVDGRLDVVSCTAGCDSTTPQDFTAQWNNPGTTATQDCDSAPTIGTCTQAFDIGYESLSGRALVVYGDNVADRAYYALWNGSAWSPNATPGTPGATNQIDLPNSAGTPKWIRVIPAGDNLADDRSNRAIVLIADSNDDLFAFYWNGSSFDSGTTLFTTLGLCDRARCFDGNWQRNNTFVVSYTNAGVNEIRYQVYTVGSGWSGDAQAYTTASAPMWIQSSADPTSSRIYVTNVSQAEDTRGAVWRADDTNDGWTVCGSGGCPDTSTETVAGMQGSASFERFNGEGLHVYNNAANNSADSQYLTYTPTSTWGGETNIGFAAGDDLQNIKSWSSPNSDDIMIVSENVDCDMDAVMWNGSGLATIGNDRELLVSNTNNSCANGTPIEGMGVGYGYDFAWKMYSPWGHNWRWTDDETNATPGSWLANENIAPSTVQPDADTVRLRFGFVNRGVISQALSAEGRKKLQYTTDSPDSLTATWTDVDADDGSGIWRYNNCTSGTDDSAIPSAQLTAPSGGTNEVGDFIEGSGNITMTHSAGPAVAVENDYCIESNGATGSTTYYFRAYDNQQQTPVFREQTSYPATPCGGGSSACSYPSLTTAAAVVSIAGNSNIGTGTTVRVAVNNSLQSQTATVQADTSWSIASVPKPSNNDIITVFATDGDGDIADASESTGITRYSGSGSITGMVLNVNVLSIGDAGTRSVTVTDLCNASYNYDNGDDEDVMHTCSGTTLTVDGGNPPNGNYSAEKIDILSGDTLTVGGAGEETVTTYDLAINGTLNLSWGIANVSHNWTNNGSFTYSLSTVNMNGSTAQTITTNGQNFQVLTLNNTGADGTTDDITISGALDVSGAFNITNGDLILNSGNPNVSTMGDVAIGSSAFITKGSGTWTFTQMGGTITVTDSTETKQDLGAVVIDTAGTLTVNLGSSITATSMQVKANTILGLGSSGYTLTLSGSGTGTSRPLYMNGGSLTEGTNSTVRFTGGSSATEIQAETYWNLEISPAATGASFTLGTTGSQTITINGNFTMNDGSGTETVAVNWATYDPALAIGGNLTLNDYTTWTKSDLPATLTFNGTTSPVTWTDNNTSAKQDIGAVAINGTTKHVDIGSSVKATSVNIAASQTLDFNGSNTLTLTGTGSPLTKTGNITLSTGTVDYNGAAQTVESMDYNNLTLSNSGTKTLQTGTTSISGNFTLSGTASATLVVSLAVAGQVTVNTGATLGLGSSGYTLTLSGSGTGASRPLYMNGGTLDEGTNSSVMFTGGSSATEIQAETYSILYIAPSATGASFTLGTDNSQIITCSSFTINDGTGAETVSVNWTTYDPALNIGIGFTLRDYTTWIKSDIETLTFNGSETGYWWDFNTSKQDVGKVVIGDGLMSKTVDLSTSVTSTSIEVKTSATLDLASSGYILTLTGSGTGTSRPLYMNGGSLTEGTNSTVKFTGGSSATEIQAETYHNLEISPVATGASFTLGTAGSQTITTSGNFTVNDGSGTETVAVDWDNYDPTLNFNGNITLNNYTTWTKSTSSPIRIGINATISWTDNNTIKQDIGWVWLVGGFALTVNLGSSVSATNIEVDGATTLALQSSGYTLTLTGSGTGINRPLYMNGGTLNEGTNSTVKFTGGSSLTEIQNETYDDLVISPAATGASFRLGTGSSQVIMAASVVINDFSGTETVTVDWDNYDPTLNFISFLLCSYTTWTKSNSATLTLVGTGSGSLGDSNSPLQDIGNVQVGDGTNARSVLLSSNVRLTNLTVANNGTFNHNGRDLNLSGNLQLDTGAQGSNYTKGGTLTFDGTGTNTITDSNGTKQDLGTVVIGDGADVKAVNLGSYVSMTNLTLKNNASFGFNGSYQLTLLGNLQLDSSSIYTKGGLSPSLLFKGTGSNSITDSNTSKQDLGHIDIGDTTNAKTISLLSSVKIASLTVRNNATFSHNGANNLNLIGSLSLDTGAQGSTYTKGGTLTLDSGGTGVITDANVTKQDLGNVVIGDGINAKTTILNNNAARMTNLTVANNATFSHNGANNLNLSGNLQLDTGAQGSTYTKGGTLTFDGTGTYTITDSNGTKRDLGTVVIGDGTNAKTISLNGTAARMTNLTVANNATFSHNGSNNLNLSGNLALNTGAQGSIYTKGGTLTFDGTGTNTITDSNGTKQDLGTVVIGDGTNAKTINLNATAARMTNLTVANNGTFSHNGANNLNLGGNLQLNTGVQGSTYTKGGSLTFNGTGTNTITDSNGTKQDLGSVYVGDGSIAKVINLATAAKMSGLYVRNNGTFSHNGANNLNIGGAAGAFSLNAGSTFIKGGILTFDGDANIWDVNSTKQDLGVVVIDGSAASVSTGSSVDLTSLTLGADDTLNITNDTVTILGSGIAGSRPLILNGGTFTVTNSTVKFTGTGDTTIQEATYNNLELSPSGGATPAFTLATTGSQTITTQNFTVGNGTNGVSVTAATNSPILDINGDFSMSASASFTGGSQTITVGTDGEALGDFTLENGSTWTAGSGTLILDGGDDVDLVYFNDKNGTKQNMGTVQIGASPATTNLSSDMAADSLTVSTGDRLNTKGYDLDIATFITVNGTLDGTESTSGNGTNINLGTTWTVASGGTFTAQESDTYPTTVTFDHTSAGNLSPGGTDENHDFYNLSVSKSSSATITMQAAIDVENDLSIANSNSTLDTGTNYAINVGGSWSNAGTFTPGTGTVTFDSADTGETIDAGGTGAGKPFNTVVFNNSGGGWTIQTSDMKAANLTITDVSSWALAASRTLEVTGTYSIADAETSATTWDTGSVLYLNSGTAYTIGSKNQNAEVYDTVQIGVDTDLRFWKSSGNVTGSGTGSIYSQDNANIDGRLAIYGDFHTNTNEYWDYTKDFDGTDISGSPRQADVRINGLATVTVDSGDILEAIGTSSNRTLITRQSTNGYGFVVAGGAINIQYANFDYLDGNKGLDIQTGSTVTNLDYTNFDNLVGSAATDDAYITVASTVIGSATKTITGVNFDRTDTSVEFNVNRTGADPATNYWDFDASTGTYDGEAYDGDDGVDEADPGFLRWDDSTASVFSLVCAAAAAMPNYTLGDTNNYNIKDFTSDEKCTVTDISYAPSWSLTLQSTNLTGAQNNLANTNIKLTTNADPTSTPTLVSSSTGISEPVADNYSLDQVRTVVQGAAGTAEGTYDVQIRSRLENLNTLHAETGDVATMTFTLQ